MDIRKIRDYALDPDHEFGKHKARVFAAALGFTVGDAETLHVLLLNAAQAGEVVTADQDEFGQRFIIDFEIERNEFKATVRSAWIVRTDEDFPRLTSCYVLL